LAVIAALFGPGEVKVLAQGVQQRGSRIEGEVVSLAVHFEADGHRRNSCTGEGSL
jgi:hypothetical protein